MNTTETLAPPTAPPSGTAPTAPPSGPAPAVPAPAPMPDPRIEAACAQACGAIAPSWPLDRAIAVHPHARRTDRPMRRVAARLAVLGGLRVFPPRSELRRAWEAGRIAPRDLAEALDRLPAAAAAGWTAERCVQALASEGAWPTLPLLIDTLDRDAGRPGHLRWRQAITHQVGQTCAAYFDTWQADWPPERGQGLYAFWRDSLRHDHGIGLLMGLPGLGRRLDALPATARDAERWALQRLGLPDTVWADYLEAVLLTVNGWASWCAYLGWQAALAGRTDPHLRELLALRLAWGALLLDCPDDADTRLAFAAVRARWERAADAFAEAEAALRVDEVWQLALELGYQRDLARRLAPAQGVPAERAPDAEVQAVFCIDVRSERLRRALEAAWPAVRTLGFAGFFGVPLAYTPLGTSARRPQLPGLLAPALEAVDRLRPAAGELPEPAGQALQRAAARARRTRLRLAARWDAATRWPGAAFSFVEAAGAGNLGALAGWLRPSDRPRPRDDLAGLPRRWRALCRPHLQGLSVEARVDLAARVLQALGLGPRVAPLVVLVGHGSQSSNNAHAAALQCGACGGQTGEVNARSLAALLNEPAVRTGLRARGMELPAATVFAAALHDTTTDEVEGFDTDLLPPPARARWNRLTAALAQAGDQVRRERAPSLGLDPRAPAPALLTRLRRRANDGAQTRPEWGLAGNAAFVIAPRHRTRGVVLDGRCFLHDYEAARDPDGRLLEQLMTAPMGVAQWINGQYHASTCDPEHLGSGNKLLHNVVGGRLGVFEGNGGDLRIGLARQSLHDGERWVHEPLRLTVLVDAPRPAIERVLREHVGVRHLVEHGWLHLWHFGAHDLQRYDAGAWRPAVRA